MDSCFDNTGILIFFFSCKRTQNLPGTMTTPAAFENDYQASTPVALSQPLLSPRSYDDREDDKINVISRLAPNDEQGNSNDVAEQEQEQGM